MSMLFVRRKGVGYWPCRGITECLADLGVEAKVWRSDKRWVNTEYVPDVVVRWGTTCSLPTSVRGSRRVVNTTEAIQTVNDKLEFSRLMQRSGSMLQPECVHVSSGSGFGITGGMSYVLRPRYHSKGENLFVVTHENVNGIIQENAAIFRDGFYLRELIDKAKEFRVFVLSGRVLCVAEKIPEDRTVVAWNNSNSDTEFVNVRWGEWPLDVCSGALAAHNLSGLDFSAVDMMVSTDGIPYVLEVNSAPGIPFLSDGTVGYRHKCLAKGFAHLYNNLDEEFNPVHEPQHFREVIHPSQTGTNDET